MKKEEVLKYCNKKSKEGYLTHKMLLEIYKDGEDVPNEIVELVCYKPKFQEQVFMCNKELYEKIKTFCI